MEVMVQAKKREKIAAVLFYIAFAIELVMIVIDKSAYTNPIEGQLFRVTFLLFLAKLCMTKYNTKEWAVMIAFGILGACSYFATERNEIIRIVVFIAAAKNIPVRNIMKSTFYTLVISTVVLVLLSLVGVLGDVAIVSEYRPGIIEKRYVLGLGHPNALHCIAWSIVIAGIYLYFEKLKWHSYLLLFLGNIGLYLLTDSKTGVIITAVTILAAAFLYLFPKARGQKWIYILGALVVLGCFIASIVAAKYGYWPQGPLMGIDQYLTGRIRWSYFYGGIPTWSLFSVPGNDIYFDMGFIRLFYWYGIVPGVTFMIVHLLFVWNCLKQKDSMALLVIVIFSVYTIFEAHAISVYIPRNFVLLLLSGCWSQVLLATGSQERYFWQIFNKEGKNLESN